MLHCLVKRLLHMTDFIFAPHLTCLVMYHDEMMLNGFMTLNYIIEPLQKSMVVCKLNGTILFTQSLSEIYTYGLF